MAQKGVEKLARLLIVDDDSNIRKLVRTYAELDSLECEEADSGQAALEMIKNKNYDIMILDVMMPGMDGFFTLEKLRKSSNIPVIMLTARNEEYDKLWCFKLGADDYVSKPFSPRELIARVQAVLRRNGPRTEVVLQFGNLAIMPESRTVTADGNKLNLSPKEFDLLLKLAQNENIVMSRERLLDTVWEYSYYGDGRTVDTHIKSLRDHLGPYRNLIKTVWGVGYKFEYNKKTEE